MYVDVESLDGDTSGGERSRNGSEEPAPLTRRTYGSGKKRYVSAGDYSSGVGSVLYWL